jgi:hypothetical protein
VTGPGGFGTVLSGGSVAPVLLAPVEVRLYANPASYTVLTNAVGATWREELSQRGTGSFSLPVADATAVTPRKVVAFYWQGAERFAFRITDDSCKAAVDDTKMVDVSGPGTLSMFGDGVVYPEYGIARASGTERRFGYMSKQGTWYARDPWATPPVVTPFTSYSRYPVYPANLVTIDPAASWLSVLAVTNYSWFRKEWTSATAIPQARLFACSDDDSEWYLDGEQILTITGDATVLNSLYQADFPIPAGPHVLACRVTDRLKWPGEMAMGEIIATIREVPDQSSITGADVYGPVVVHTDSSWKALTDLQGHAAWHRAEILLQLIDIEAQARLVTAIRQLLWWDFDGGVDSAGNAWTDYLDYTVPVGTPLDDVISQLCESEIDTSMSHPFNDFFTLQAWKRKGADRSETVQLTLAGNLADYTTSRTSTVVTTLVGQLADGTWLETTDSAGTSTWGRVERGVAFGSTADKVTGLAFSQGVLAETADQVLAVESRPGLLTGAVGYVDYQLGDTITVPGHRGIGTMRARVLALNVAPDGENWACWPELVQDLS